MKIDRFILFLVPQDLNSEWGNMLAGVRLSGDGERSLSQLRKNSQKLLQSIVQIFANLEQNNGDDSQEKAY